MWKYKKTHPQASAVQWVQTESFGTKISNEPNVPVPDDRLLWSNGEMVTGRTNSV